MPINKESSIKISDNNIVKDGKVTCILTSRKYDKDEPGIVPYYARLDSGWIQGYCNKLADPSGFKRYFMEVYMEMDSEGVFIKPKVVKSQELEQKALRAYFLCVIDENFKVISPLILSDLKARKMFFEKYVEDMSTNIFHKKPAILQHYICLAKTLGIDFSSDYEMYKDKIRPDTYINTLGKKYTWGMEVETISGLVPAYLGQYIDFQSVHDGSLRHKDDDKAYGKEYVTGVSVGDSGLLNLRLMLNEINKRCILNNQCGNHIHIGRVSLDKLSVIYMYYFYFLIQNEVSLLLPIDRVNGKYTKFLPSLPLITRESLISNNISAYDIDCMYTAIFSFTSNGIKPSKTCNRKKNHPDGKKCGFKLNTARYSWVNFVTALFNTRGNKVYTVEFRMPEGSFDYYNNKMWLLLCIALVDYTSNYRQDFIEMLKSNTNLTLEHIINTCYGSKGKKVLDFINERKSKEVVIDYHTKPEILENITIKDL